MLLSRLVKTRSNVNVVQPEETTDDERPARQSIADLQTRRVVTTQRQLLHRKFSDTYAESLRSSACFDGIEPPLYRAVSSSVLNQQTDITSLPSVMPKASLDAVQPLGAPMGKLDIEQAINLLQELKKTASPEELVSLHRALLPVKEVSTVYSPQIASVGDSVFSGSFPPDRRRSVMPPGLATRSGHCNDVLRKPQYSSTVLRHSPSRERREMWVHAAQREASGAHVQTSSRPDTPSEQPNTGVYHAGTLRITNGAASPDPSIISKIATTAAISEGDRPRADLDMKYSQGPERSRPGGPRHPQRQPRVDVRAETGERQRSRSASKPSPEARRLSFDNAVCLPASPSGTRFQQRWNHRAEHLSQQYVMDCEINDSPFDERTAHLELAKRLSSVRDFENEGPGQQSDPYTDAVLKSTGAVMPAAAVDTTRSDFAAGPGASEERYDTGSPTRGLRKADSGYGSDIPHSPHQQQALRDTCRSDGPTTLAVSESQTPLSGPNTPAISDGTRLSQDSTSMYNFDKILSDARANYTADAPLASIAAKRASPLAFFKFRHTVPKKSSLATPSDEPAAVVTALCSPVHGTHLEAVRRPKRLQKRAPDSVRRQRQLEVEKQAINDQGLESTMTDQSTRSVVVKAVDASGTTDDARLATPDVADDGHHRFRLRGKNFGRRRSRTNPSEHSTETVLHTPALRTRVRRSISASGHLPTLPDRTNRMSSPEQRQQSSDQNSPDFGPVARVLSSNPPYNSHSNNRSIPWRRSVQECRLTIQDSTQSSHAVSVAHHELPQNVPMPKAPPRATLESSQRVIPIGGYGSVEDLFPEWHSRPAGTPPPQSASSPTYLQVRQDHKPRRSLSISSIPPLPELPADIESKVTRADQMVAKKMMNSPRNSARNSPQPSVRDSVDSPSQLAKKPLDRSDVLQHETSHRSNLGSMSEPSKWSIDGSIVLPPAAEKSQPASPTHESRHPGWPGFEKQAEMWRQRKVGPGYAPKKFVDVAAITSVESEASPPSPPIVVSRYITPPGADNTNLAQHMSEKNRKAEKLAEAYSQLFADDKENWPAQRDVHRTDSVDSTATSGTTCSEGREVKADISRTGSAYSNASSTATAASSNTSTGVFLSPVVEKKASFVRPQSYTPYRPADAVQAERSRALSLARRSYVSMPQTSSASVLDRYGGGLGYGWDRSSGFGGSAGTRSSAAEATNRKSVKISEDYGLDLSDVPVFLRKVQAGN